jgi:hypothetical protein
MDQVNSIPEARDIADEIYGLHDPFTIPVVGDDEIARHTAAYALISPSNNNNE